MNKLIEAIIMAVFGLVVLLTGIFTQAGIEIIVLGGLGLLVGIIFVVMEIANKNKEK